MQLSRQNTTAIRSVPLEIFEFPERILQFGTGVFIRGLIDYFIDKGNREGTFKGRAVVVKSTAAGDIETFHQQDNLYTLVMRGAEDGLDTEETVICSAISRVLDAKTQWQQVVASAANPDINIIISNTTEVGIVFDETDKIEAPKTYPGRLLAWLYERFKQFHGSAESGVVIIPTELIPDNATKLKNIVNEMAVTHHLNPCFIEWMNTANEFCNSLVDRIVPGKMPAGEHAKMEERLGYGDQLMIMSEPFGLWAIETSSARTKKMLSFSQSHGGIHLVDSIEKFRELKLRLLNGSHNLSCAAGVLAGFATVKEAMADVTFDRFMQRLILEDISNAITSDLITQQDAVSFGTKVLKRYRNPHVEFQWLSICVQDTSKIKIRAVPIVLQHFRKYGYVPDCIALGFAAYMLFMRSEKREDGKYIGEINNQQYVIEDDFAENLYQKWKRFSGIELVITVLKDNRLWDADLAELKGFPEHVNHIMQSLQQRGFFKTFDMILKQPAGQL